MKIEKKILMITSLLNYGGASKMFTVLANYYVSEGYDVVIYCYRGKNKPSALNKKIKFIASIDTKKTIWGSRLSPLFDIRKIIKNVKPDIIVSFLTNANFYTLIANIGNKIPVIISERSDPYYENNLILSSMRKSYSLATKIVFQTHGAKNFFADSIQEKSKIIPNPIDQNIKIPVKSEEKNGTHKISFVGRFDIQQKRQDVMIEAFKNVCKVRKDIVLHFYGDGKDINLIKDYVKDNRMEPFVKFEGKVDNILEHIKDSTLYVLTSDYEGIPNSLIEAMSIGLPVISTDCSPGGAKFLINNFENGLLIPKDNIVELSESILYLLDNPKLRNLMGENALKVNERFEYNKIMAKWKDLIDGL